MTFCVGKINIVSSSSKAMDISTPIISEPPQEEPQVLPNTEQTAEKVQLGENDTLRLKKIIESQVEIESKVKFKYDANKVIPLVEIPAFFYL